jgi:predicted alpha/beta hydrolase
MLYRSAPMPRLSERRIATADGTCVAVHRLETATAPHGLPVLLAAGTFTSRMFWLGTRQQGFAYHLAEAGFDTWILEPRGRGSSDRPPHWTIDDWIRFDAPAAVAEVIRTSGHERLLWVGHSAGGVVGAAMAASGNPVADRLGGLVLLGAPGPDGLRGGRRLGAWTALLLSAAIPFIHWPGRSLGLGPEREPGRLVRDWMWWNLSRRWRGRQARIISTDSPG